ncbi:serine hydrolase domain-containing protein [Rubripirellula reticaptiva]|uniref:D-alanyl-D-alanine-carboxypeptidase/endopeptidase AmpH n=1 Tax=Rubripirellula reticaptiva TaxID=2528013 RepID=A0A5C6EJ30_9BACT|nr:serine hydrolase domain-containing protein [Rubripirellula reticaptiva]TWU49753.1 D-alanyl-D-alanine-carboxypeptidase/endopeptidase AmpH precursor [Rubripirellula reticaptiva]
MNLEKFQQAWKADADQTCVTIDVDLLSREVQRDQQNFRSTIFWRDVREAGGSLILIPIWFTMGFVVPLPWTWYLCVPGFLWVATFILVDRQRHPQRPSGPGQPLGFYAKESLVQVDHQIWLLRNVVWWYLLPYAIPAMAFFLHVTWQAQTNWWNFLLLGGFFNLFLVVLHWVIYRVNQNAIRTQLEPRRQDLLKLVASLEDDANSEDGGDIMELVAALAVPIHDAGLSPGWERWAATWNRLIPSWGAAATIMVPTMIGGCCGFLYPTPDMGPAFFQTVVAAVIPFEIAFGCVWLRSYVKQKRSTLSRDDANSPLSVTVLARSSNETLTRLDMTESTLAATHSPAELKRLPEAPAIVIIVLTLFIGTMAIFAVFACVAESKETPLTIPALSDVSAFNSDDVSRLDTWMQKFVDGGYPSLSAVVVRDGEVVYRGAFGLANIKADTKATLHTQYNVASVTKAFTALLAAILHDHGVIDLDQPVAKYLPTGVTISKTPDVGATITLRQLASHTSGLPRGVPGRVQSVEGWYELEPPLLYDHLSNVQLESKPGVAEEYSNLGFGLLGHALELAADKPLDQLMQELVCDPLKLEQTAIQADDTLRPATGYAERSRIEKTHSFQQRLAASGGLVTSIEDLGKFLAAQMKPSVFSPEILAQLHTQTKLSDGSTSGTSLGWSVRSRPLIGRLLKKNGGRNNCSAWMGFAPEQGVGVAIVTNCGGPDVDPIGYRLLEQSIPLSQRKLVTSAGFAKVAPYTGVRWEQDQPTVCVRGQWAKLVSVNDVPIAGIMDFAKREYKEKAQKRFAEDLVEVLSKMGHQPDWMVTLELKAENGQVERSQVLMTAENRKHVRRSLRP